MVYLVVEGERSAYLAPILGSALDYFPDIIGKFHLRLSCIPCHTAPINPTTRASTPPITPTVTIHLMMNSVICTPLL